MCFPRIVYLLILSAKIHAIMLADFIMFGQCNSSLGMTKKSYVEAVLNGFKAVETVKVLFDMQRGGEIVEKSENDHKNKAEIKSIIHVKLLLSIDRRESTQSAIDTVGIKNTF